MNYIKNFSLMLLFLTLNYGSNENNDIRQELKNENEHVWLLPMMYTLYNQDDIRKFFIESEDLWFTKPCKRMKKVFCQLLNITLDQLCSNEKVSYHIKKLYDQISTKIKQRRFVGFILFLSEILTLLKTDEKVILDSKNIIQNSFFCMLCQYFSCLNCKNTSIEKKEHSVIQCSRDFYTKYWYAMEQCFLLAKREKVFCKNCKMDKFHMIEKVVERNPNILLIDIFSNLIHSNIPISPQENIIFNEEHYLLTSIVFIDKQEKCKSLMKVNDQWYIYSEDSVTIYKDDVINYVLDDNIVSILCFYNKSSFL